MEQSVLAVVVWLLAALTLTTGVGAGVVYAPMFVIFYGLDISTAVATSILIQLAGVGTTGVGHALSRESDRSLSLRLGLFGVGGALVAWTIKDRIPVTTVEIIFVLSMLTIGVWLFIGARSPGPILGAGDAPRQFRLADDGSEYDFCKPKHGYGFGVLAGVATSVLGVSGAEIQITALIARCRVPTAIAIGTGTVAATLALLAASLLAVFGEAIDWQIAVVAAPAATLGSWSARRAARHIPDDALRFLLSLLVIASALGVMVREVVL